MRITHRISNCVRPAFAKLSLALLGREEYARRIGVRIGSGCRISTTSWGSEPYLIEIGNNVHLTAGVSFVTHDGGVWAFRRTIPAFDVFGSIMIGDDCYIGNNAIILPGIRIGRTCIVGANSVVTKSIPNGVVAAGNPARFICYSTDYLQRMSERNFETHGMRPDRKRAEILRLIASRGIEKRALVVTPQRDAECPRDDETFFRGS